MKRFKAVVAGAIFSCMAVMCSSASSEDQQKSGPPYKLIDTVSITIHLDGEQYQVEVEWIVESQGNTEWIDVNGKAKASSRLGTWSRSTVIDSTHPVSSRISALIDNEMIVLDAGYGTSLGVFVEQRDAAVYAKGIFAATTHDQTVRCPFSGLFKLGEPTIIYSTAEYSGDGFKEPIREGPFQPIKGGEKLFK